MIFAYTTSSRGCLNVVSVIEPTRGNNAVFTPDYNETPPQNFFFRIKCNTAKDRERVKESLRAPSAERERC